MLTIATPASVLARHSDHPSAFLALNRETRHFQVEGIDGLIAWRAAGGWAFQLGGVFAAPEDRRRLLEAFRAHVRAEGKRLCVLELRREDIPLYREAGFRVNQLGMSFGLDLGRFKTSGSRFMQLRNKVSRARRAGIAAGEVGVDVERTPELEARLQELTRAWLEAKGKKKLLDFLVGELGGPHELLRRTFVAHEKGRVVAFITYVPVWGTRSGWLHDLCRRDPDAPPGVMELVNVTAIERFQGEGASALSFGLTPLVGLGPERDDVPERSRAVSWLLGKLARHGSFIYPAQSQAAYKEKWEPHYREPEYFAFEGRFKLGCLLRLLELTRAL